MKNAFKNGITIIKQRTRFIQGFVVGLFIMSALSYAAVTLTTFTANTTISAADVNANFAALKAKVDQMDVGIDATKSTNQTITCGNSMSYPDYPVDFTVINVEAAPMNDGGLSLATDIYTVPATDIYRIFLEANDTLDSPSGYEVRVEISTDGGLNWSSEGMGYTVNLVKKLPAGAKIRPIAGCGTMYNTNAGSAIINASKFTFAIRKF